MEFMTISKTKISKRADAKAKPVESAAKEAYVYMLRCRDGSLYTGITTDLNRRLAEHLSGGKEAAKYTRSHPPSHLAAAFAVSGLKEAARFEYAIKRLDKKKKEELVKNPRRIGEMLPLLAELPCSPVETSAL